MQSKDSILRWQQRVDTLHHNVYHAVSDDKYTTKEHVRNVARWLACAEGTRRALGWALGVHTYKEAFYCLRPQFLKNMRLPFWVDKWGTPTGRLPFSEEDPAPHDLRSIGDIRLMLKTANKIHSRVFNIDKFHPGAWHPMFHDRVKDWLVFVAGVIRALDWILGQRTESDAFYVFSDRAMDELMKAQSGIQAYSADALVGLDNLLEMDLTEENF